MNKKRIWRNLILILVFSAFLALTTNPYKLPELEADIPVITPLWNWMQESQISLGLDLQGGTQLDYEIDLSDAQERNNDEDPDNDVNVAELLDGVKDVIERRVNSLGVAEPNIYLSSAGDEQHIVVELPGVEDISDAKDKVGKVVQLEFKTEKENADEVDIDSVRNVAGNLLARIQAAEPDQLQDLEEFFEDDLEPNKIEYKISEELYIDEFPDEIKEVLLKLDEGEFYDGIVQAKEEGQVYMEGRAFTPEGLNIFRLKAKLDKLRRSPVNTESFADVMKDFDQTYTSGDEFYREIDIQPEDITLEIIALQKGEISDVIDGKDGLYVAQMNDKLLADTGDNAEPDIRTAHILFKTQQGEQPIAIKPLKEIPDDASEEEVTRLNYENSQIETENEVARQRNEEIAKANAAKEVANAEQKAQAEEILAQLKEDPSRFAELAKEYSEDTSAENGGDLGYAKPSAYVGPYSEAALALEPGQITEGLVESQFGYHIIKLIDNKAPNDERYQYSYIRLCYEGTEDCERTVSKEDAQAEADELVKRLREETAYTVERIWVNATPSPWEETDLDGKYFKSASVAYDQTTYRPYVQIQFDDEGAQKFADLTEANIQKPIGIFVGGEFISAPVVQQKITGGTAQITLGTPNVQIALQEANELARSLNAGSIPAPLKKPDELNIGASLGAEALQQSIYAGMLGLILVALFMVLYYRMLGVLAALSLIVYGLFLTFILQSQVAAVLSISITFALWIGFALRLFQSKIDGLGKAIFLTFSVFGVLFVFSVLVNPIVLTLAGVAGLILSIGMAVDANILIFERIREEFDDGKSFVTAVNDGFERAWSSILDSNVSSLITCAILFSFGTSIIKGFAINLAAGIVISMFSAITITKTFLLAFEGSELEKKKWLWKRKK